MIISKLQETNLIELESILLDKDGLLKPVSYSTLKNFQQNDISYFCWKYGIYQIPTIELIDWLTDEINGRFAIEIGAGNGSIGTALNIPITDNRLQERPDIIQHYKQMNQPVITYHPNTINLEGNDAVDELKPQVVIASWVTQLWTSDVQSGNYWGVDEEKIIESESVEQYIHIGNNLTHANKKVLQKYNFKKIKFDWLVSRSLSKDENIIYTYSK